MNGPATGARRSAQAPHEFSPTELCEPAGAVRGAALALPSAAVEPASFDTLVILGSSITAVAVVRDAHAHGLRAVVADTDHGHAFASRWAVGCSLADADDDERLSRLLRYRGPGSALIATSDRWLRFVVDHRAALQPHFGRVLHPSNDALSVCLDKLRFARWCAEQGLPTPRAWIGGVESMPVAARFPLLVRPMLTAHGDKPSPLPKAVEASNRAELEAWLTRYAEHGIEALVSESLLGLDLEQCAVAFARSPRELLSFTTRKVRPAPERCTVGSCVEMHPDPAVEAMGREAVQRLDFYGIGEVEILRDRASGELHLIEINARPWLQYALAPASGHDFLGVLLGTPARPRVRTLRSGKTWIDAREDLFNALSRSVGEVRQGRTTFRAYAASALRGNVFALFDPRDPLPFIRSLKRGTK
jgi:predicted ATP-grasp superfamily ATP-dependent carboligase